MGTLALGSVLACGKKGGDSPSSEGTNSPTTDGGGGQVALPEPPAAAGQLILTLDTGVDPSTVSGYVVGKQDLLKIERAKSGEYFIHNVPAGTHDVVVVASTSGASLWDSLLLKSDKSPDMGVRLNKVEVLNGIRTKKEKVKLPSLMSVSGTVTLSNQTDHAGIDVYIPGTEYVAKTDSKGAFFFAGVPAGTHNFFFERDGYVRGQMEGVDVDKEPAQSLDAMTLLVDTGTEGFMVLNEGAAVSASKEVKVTLGAGSDSVVMKISENPDFAGAPWKALKTTFTYKFQTGGNKILYAKIANANGLESSPFSAQVLIANQAQGSLVLNDGAAVSSSKTVKVSIEGKSDSVSMMISENSDFSGASWQTLEAISNYTFSTDGTKVLHVKIANAENLESTPFSDSITVASQEPLPVVSVSSLNCRDASLLLNISTINGAAPISQMMVSSTGNMTGQNWENYSTTKSIARAHLSGLILVKLKDIFGREKQSQLNEIQCLNTLSEARAHLAATSVGNKALFAGGRFRFGENIFSSAVDIFDHVTYSWSSASLSLARAHIASTSVGNKTIFAGGYSGRIGVEESSDVVDIFDLSAGTWSVSALSQLRGEISATSVGNKAFFAGGSVGPGQRSSVVEIYDATTGAWSTASLSLARSHLSAISIGAKVLFAGGSTGAASSNLVDIYDSSTGAWSTATLSQARYELSAARVGTKLLFSGGWAESGISNVVDIYDSESGAWSTATLSQSRVFLSATTVGNKAFFSGGRTASGLPNVVDIYDSSTGGWSTASLSQARQYLSATSIGNLAIFAGGDASGAYSNVVDIYDSNTNTWSTMTTIDLTQL